MENNKVLFLVNHEVVIYNFRKEIVEALLEQGYEVLISSPHGSKIDELVSMGCKHYPLNISRHGTNPFEELSLLRNYKKLIKDTNPLVVLSFTIKPNIYGGIAAKSLGVPYVANITGLGTALENNGLLQKILIPLYRYAFSSIDRVYFQNEENRQFFIDNKIALGHHQLLPGSGVNLDHFQVMPYPKDENIDFVFISRIMKEKGIDEYLEAAEIIHRKYPKTTFHICGFCEEDYIPIMKQYEEKGFVKYHGMVQDIRTILKNTNCTIHPTYYPEGMSNVLLESAASGRPVISTNRSGCREIIDHSINGYITEPRNVNDLVEKIEIFLHLSSKEQEKMGLEGRKKVEREFDRKIVVDSYLEVIEKIENK